MTVGVQRRQSRAPVKTRLQTRSGTRSFKVSTGKPGSVVFINNIRHGVTNAEGVLEVPRIKTGSYPVRIRTMGFVDWNGTIQIIPGSEPLLKCNQLPTEDQAIIHFQKAEDLRDKDEHEQAVNEYYQALGLRPEFPLARIGMTRSLTALHKYAQAEEQIREALKQPGAHTSEAQTVLANLFRGEGLVDEAIISYEKALLSSRGINPEAHIGLAIALEESDETGKAIEEYRKGIAQNMDTEPILYYLLGNILDKNDRRKEAIEAYKKYLELDPQGKYSSAVDSMIVRMQKEVE